MKSKLLLSSALISGLALAGSAVAETKISGNLDISLGSRSADTAQNSSNGFGNETQINIKNSGDLNNGMSYNAGFSIESDDSTDAFEGVHLNINLAEGSMLHFGNDKFPGIDGTVTPKVSVAADTMTGVSASSATAAERGLYRDGTYIDAVERQGVGFSQDLGGIGDVGLYYAPSHSVKGSTQGNDTVNNASTDNSSTMMRFKGNLGVEGLTVLVGQEKLDNTGSTSDEKSRQYGISYNFGQFAIGATGMKHELDDDTEIDTKEAGITFAATDNLSLGISYHESDDDASGSTADEEITMVQAGYNLGGVYVSLNYAQVENRDGLSANGDDDYALLRLGTKF